MTDLVIVKVGGQVLENARTRAKFITAFTAIPATKLLVHGGGKIADTFLEKLGISPRMVEGRRVTDAATLEIVTMVYGGLINRQLVAALQFAGDNALGISGADGGTITSRRRPPQPYDFGYVGDIVQVDAASVGKMLSAGYTPVVCPLTYDGAGQLLNTNADTVATKLAIALSAFYRVSLRFCQDYPGVMRDRARSDSVVQVLDHREYLALRNGRVVVDGMIPKLENAFAARRDGICEVVIAGLDTLSEPGKATRIEL